LKSSNKRYQQRCNDFLDAGKDNTHTTNIKCLEQTARNFTAFLDRKIPKRTLHQLKKKWRTFGNKYLKKRLNTMKKFTGSKTSATKMLVWNGAHYLKWRSHRY